MTTMTGKLSKHEMNKIQTLFKQVLSRQHDIPSSVVSDIICMEFVSSLMVLKQ